MTERGSGKRIGVVGVPGAWSTERLAEAIAARTGFRLVIDPARVVCDLGRGTATCDGVDLASLDALVVKKIGHRYGPDLLDRLELLRFIESRGVRLFSRPGSVQGLIDRLSCTVTLRAAGIPMPPTVITEDLDGAIAAVDGFGQAVLKPLFSTKAQGMVVIDAGNGVDWQRAVRDFHAGNPVLYVQQRIALPGRDLGIAFLGGEHVGTYARVAGDGKWNTTPRDGGRYAAHETAPEVIDLARKAQALFDLDFTTVDVVETAAGPMVFEVSAFGGFRGLWEGLGIDMGARYADYVLQRLGG